MTAAELALAIFGAVIVLLVIASIVEMAALGWRLEDALDVFEDDES